MVFGKKRAVVVKVAEKWLNILEQKTPEELADMAKEIKQIRAWKGDHWDVEAYELLLEDNGTTTVAIDTDGGVEVVYKGNFVSIPLSEDRKHKAAYRNVKSIKHVLDGRLGA